MSGENDKAAERYSLGVELPHGSVSVSYLSSLLRVIQAALREVAMSDDGARAQFDRRPQPVLVLSRLASDDKLRIYLVFIDPIDRAPMPELSTRTFDAFLDRLGEFVTSLPQRGLWGGSARPSPGRPFESEVSRRMYQVYGELRRTRKATLRFQDRSIEIEGDRMEIG